MLNELREKPFAKRWNLVNHERWNQEFIQRFWSRKQLRTCYQVLHLVSMRAARMKAAVLSPPQAGRLRWDSKSLMIGSVSTAIHGMPSYPALRLRRAECPPKRFIWCVT